MEADELGTFTAIGAILSEVIIPGAARHHGRVVKTTGDGAILEFPSPVEAVACGMEVQREVMGLAFGQAEHKRLLLRIGINLGDVILAEDGELYGDGVNVAVRIQQIAEPGGICISGKVFDELRGKIALEFEDRGDQQLKNIARPIRIHALRGNPVVAPSSMQLPLPDKPSIAVLPFSNIGGEPKQDYFADGIADDILTALGRLKWLFVSARNSTFTYKGRTVDPKRVGAELGVRYLLHGSVRRSGSRVRITSRLIEADTGTQIWADRYEGRLEDVFDLQDQITTSVAGAIEPRLRQAEIARARLKPPENLSSYDCFLQALAHFYEGTQEGVERALSLLEHTIARDPAYVQPYALAAWCHVYHIAQGWSDDVARDGARAVKLARAAIEVERDDPTVMWMAAVAIGYLAQDIDTALLLLDRALNLNPSSASAYMMSGWVHCWAGDEKEAILHFHRAMRLSPVDRTMVTMQSGLALAFCMGGQYEHSLLWCRKAIAEQASWSASYRPLAASFAHLGRSDEARQAVNQLAVFEPGCSVSKIAALYRPSEGAERYFEGLRKAGLPE
jgi:adenylate cyclase